MKCPKCDTFNEDNVSVCVNCGEILDTDDDLVLQQDKNARIEEIQSRRIKKKKAQKRKKVATVCIIIALLIGAATYALQMLNGDIIDRTEVDDKNVVVTPSPTLESEPTAAPTEFVAPTETVLPTEEVITPVITAMPTVVPVTTVAPQKPVSTKKPVSKPIATAKPIVTTPGFVAGSILQTPVAQGDSMVSQIVSVNAVETAQYTGKAIAKFTIGNEIYFGYADASLFTKGMPAIYAIDAVATADVYYGLPVYNISKVDAFSENGYIIEKSATVLLTEADLSGLTKSQLELARNEIFARHGRIFKRQEVQEYFNSKAWYKVNPAYNYSNDYLNLSEIELANSKFILAYENR